MGGSFRKFASALDVVGYNYSLDRYEKDHALFPQRVICGTESFPLQALENWQAVKHFSHVIGDFVWVAWDYIGESGLGRSEFDTKTKSRRHGGLSLAHRQLR